MRFLRDQPGRAGIKTGKPLATTSSTLQNYVRRRLPPPASFDRLLGAPVFRGANRAGEHNARRRIGPLGREKRSPVTIDYIPRHKPKNMIPHRGRNRQGGTVGATRSFRFPTWQGRNGNANSLVPVHRHHETELINEYGARHPPAPRGDIFGGKKIGRRVARRAGRRSAYADQGGRARGIDILAQSRKKIFAGAIDKPGTLIRPGKPPKAGGSAGNLDCLFQGRGSLAHPRPACHRDSARHHGGSVDRRGVRFFTGARRRGAGRRQGQNHGPTRPGGLRQSARVLTRSCRLVHAAGYFRPG